MVECGKPQFFVFIDLPYTKDYIKENFYINILENGENGISYKEKIMKKDGSEILFFKDDELLNSQLVEYIEDSETKYHYDKINIGGRIYDITPGMLLGVEFMRRFYVSMI